MIYSLLRPALFMLDAETAHGLSLAALKALPLGGTDHADGPLACESAAGARVSRRGAGKRGASEETC